ncbi:hypothetical protein GOP47_0010789 [Adiantum capillus-veneris]|uniref:O-fucosyltransferase family protein n=1 Tax=Adiantum capillus-veneris TaxID=13818 RepID=A0A9D4ZGP7_ADICA|nr:hypothetical protein GOP47_0010789 [Adiantum capillus-veneris]
MQDRPCSAWLDFLEQGSDDDPLFSARGLNSQAEQGTTKVDPQRGQWPWHNAEPHNKKAPVSAVAASNMMLLHHARLHMKMNLLASALSKTSMLCASLLVMLSLVSLMSGPILDLERPSPVPVALRKGSSEAYQPSRRLGDRTLVSASPTEDIWTSTLAEFYQGCSSPSDSFSKSPPTSQTRSIILIQTSGGLNQQRTGIVDAVVVSRILNATLVVPELDHNSFWKDSSNFSDIFDVEWFISTLVSDVIVVKELPSSLGIREDKIYSMRVPRKCTPDYFGDRVLPLLQKKKAVRLTKFDYRLSNKLEKDLQKLRCRVNYHALRFTPPIKAMGDSLVGRLRQRSGRYIALHLRFEPDMLAFSGCYYGGGDVELEELGLIRKRWKTLHQKNPERERRNGKCPLTPEEVGLMLRALGFGSDSHLYVASGEVYGGESTLAPLKALFPNYYTKDTLATKEELEPFVGYSSRMAAIDYMVCDESDVFVTNNNGNMARILAGRRRYFGHRRTVRPNVKKLGTLFLAKPNMTWEGFASKVRKAQKGFMGEPNDARPGRGQFFENPAACICESPKGKDELGRKRAAFKDGMEDELNEREAEEEEDDVDQDVELDIYQEEDSDSIVPELVGRSKAGVHEDMPLMSD